MEKKLQCLLIGVCKTGIRSIISKASPNGSNDSILGSKGGSEEVNSSLQTTFPTQLETTCNTKPTSPLNDNADVEQTTSPVNDNADVQQTTSFKSLSRLRTEVVKNGVLTISNHEHGEASQFAAQNLFLGVHCFKEICLMFNQMLTSKKHHLQSGWVRKY